MTTKVPYISLKRKIKYEIFGKFDPYDIADIYSN